MKEFKYTIEGKEYEVTIAAIDENNVADITVNGESYKVQIEKEAEPEKKKVVLGQPVEAAADDAPAATNVNTSNAIKAPLPGTITQICVEVGQEVKAGDTLARIAASFQSRVPGITWQQIARFNNLYAPYTLNIGQILRIPCVAGKG